MSLKVYPISAEVIEGNVTYKCLITHIEVKGCLIDQLQLIVKPSDRINIRYLLPNKRVMINSQAMVVKTSVSKSITSQSFTRVECHFLNVSDDQKKVIQEFETEYNKK